MVLTEDREAWLAAVNALEAQVREWAPEGLERREESFAEDPEARVLILSENGRRIRLEPAVWNTNTVPTSVDLYSSWGPRVRFRGPGTDGGWDVYSSDGMELPMSWDRETVRALCRNLLKAA